MNRRIATLTGLVPALILLFSSAVSHATSVRLDDIKAGALLVETDTAGEFNMARLLHTDVQMAVNGMLVRTRVIQHFRNDSDDWIEATYVFPLPDDASVDTLEMQIGEQRIVGEIQTRSMARATFQEARDSGRQTSLVELQRPNLYTTRVANIPPGDDLSITIAYQAPVHYRDGIFSLRFPLTITPRYIPGQPLQQAGSSEQTIALKMDSGGWARPTASVADADQISPPMVDTAQGSQVSLDIRLDPGMPLSEIVSSSHDIVTTQQLDQWQISLARQRVGSDRDFTLSWNPQSGQSPAAAVFRQDRATAQRGSEASSSARPIQSFASIMLIPPQDLFDQPLPPREVIFVIDTSGSMEGGSITQARTALQLGVQRLQASDRFNIIEFNDEPRLLFNAAVDANTANISAANQWIRSLYAGGGTEIGRALSAALAGGERDTRVRQIVFITDGSVGNEAEIFAKLASQLGDSRLFTVGIGSAPNTWFMRKAAELGRGTYTYIGNQAEVGTRMLALFGKLERPALTDISVHWDGVAEPQVFPATIPDLYAGEPVLADAMWAQAIANGTLQISGYHNGREWTRELDLAGDASGSGLDKRWASRAIESLDDSLLFGTDTAQIESDITALALDYGLVTRFTSLVAVADRPVRQPSTDALKKVTIPAAMPAGSTMGFPQGSLGVRWQLLLSALLCSLSVLLGIATLQQVRLR